MVTNLNLWWYGHKFSADCCLAWCNFSMVRVNLISWRVLEWIFCFVWLNWFRKFAQLYRKSKNAHIYFSPINQPNYFFTNLQDCFNLQFPVCYSLQFLSKEKCCRIILLQYFVFQRPRTKICHMISSTNIVDRSNFHQLKFVIIHSISNFSLQHVKLFWFWSFHYARIAEFENRPLLKHWTLACWNNTADTKIREV